MTLKPVTLRQAHDFVARYHRHHTPSRGGRFALGAMLGDRLVGVVVAGRPVARGLDDGWTLEITRCATDGTRNACSFLYSAAVRVAAAMGYRTLVTYTLESESGASLRGAGWRLDGKVPGHTWSRSERPRVDGAVQREDKRRWLKECAA